MKSNESDFFGSGYIDFKKDENQFFIKTKIRGPRKSAVTTQTNFVLDKDTFAQKITLTGLTLGDTVCRFSLDKLEVSQEGKVSGQCSLALPHMSSGLKTTCKVNGICREVGLTYSQRQMNIAGFLDTSLSFANAALSTTQKPFCLGLQLFWRKSSSKKSPRIRKNKKEDDPAPDHQSETSPCRVTESISRKHQRIYVTNESTCEDPQATSSSKKRSRNASRSIESTTALTSAIATVATIESTDTPREFTELSRISAILYGSYNIFDFTLSSNLGLCIPVPLSNFTVNGNKGVLSNISIQAFHFPQNKKFSWSIRSTYVFADMKHSIVCGAIHNCDKDTSIKWKLVDFESFHWALKRCFTKKFSITPAGEYSGKNNTFKWGVTAMLG